MAFTFTRGVGLYIRTEKDRIQRMKARHKELVDGKKESELAFCYEIRITEAESSLQSLKQFIELPDDTGTATDWIPAFPELKEISEMLLKTTP